MLKQIKLENGDVVIASTDVVGYLTGWIESLFKESQTLKNFGVMSALVLDTNNKIYWHGGFIHPKNIIPLSYAMNEEYYGQYPGTRAVKVPSLLCCIISKAAIEKSGAPNFDENNIFEMADYCLTLEEAGFKNYATDKVAVTFQGGPKSNEEVQKFQYQFASGADIFTKKWRGKLNADIKYPVLYSAKAGGPSGFARAARGYLSGLVQNNVNVYFEPLDNVMDSLDPTPDELVNGIFCERGDMLMPQITWGQAPWFIHNSGNYKIGHCEFEGEKLPAIWVRYCNMMNEVWVPTEWDKKKCITAGVIVPINVFPQGIDPNYFHPDYAPMTTDATENFKFLCNAAWFPRKNLRNLMVAFQSEFKKGEDVCLIIKTIDQGLNKGIENEVKDIPSVKDSAPVYVREEEIPDHRLPSLYTMADCFVMPTHGEGWGLPIFEALACGIPVITTGYGAPFEVLKNAKGEPLPGVKFIDCKMAPATENYVYMEGANWAEPNMIQLKKLMRESYNNRAAERQAAKATSAIIREKFSWQTIGKQIKDRLTEIYQVKFS